VSDHITAGSPICVERPGNESLDKYIGIGKWKLSTDITGSSNRHGRSTNSTCHGRWFGDSQLVDCHDWRCVRQSTPYTAQWFRGRRRRGASNDAVVSNTDRVMRRRRRGRRRKRSRRRRDVTVAERWTFSKVLPQLPRHRC